MSGNIYVIALLILSTCAKSSTPEDSLRQSSSKPDLRSKCSQPPAKAVRSLLVAVNDKDGQVRREAWRDLLKLGPHDAEVVPVLINSLGTDDGTMFGLVLARIGPPAVPAVVEALKDKSADVRANAAWTLGYMYSDAEQAVPNLLELLKDQNAGVRNAAAQSLAYIGTGAKLAVPSLVVALNDEEVRDNAAFALGQIGLEARSALIKALRDQKKRTRTTAAGGLVYIESIYCDSVNKEAVAILKGALFDNNDDIRREAAERLKWGGNKVLSVVPDLIRALSDKNQEVRIQAIRALSEIDSDNKSVVPALINSLKIENEDVQSEVAHALGEIGIGAKEAVSILTKMLTSKNKGLRIAAARALNRIVPGTDVALETVVAGLDDNDVRYISVAALAEFGPAANAEVSRLLGFVNDTDSLVRISAVNALSKIGDANTTVPCLISVLHDKEAFVQSAAIAALGERGVEAKPAVPVLLKLLTEDDTVQFYVFDALAEIGPVAKIAIPALRDFVKSDKANSHDAKLNRLHAAFALARIDSSDELGLQVLATGLNDRGTFVREYAIECLAQLGPVGKNAVQPLIQALKDDNITIRYRVVQALGKIDPSNDAVRSALGKALNDKDEAVRNAAARVLE